jgi:two-component system, NtrC family, nitrogen regulation sensor histidine kinase NtrY
MFQIRFFVFACLTVIFAGISFFLASRPAGFSTQAIEKRLARVIDQMDREFSLIRENPDSVSWGTLKYHFFLLDNSQVVAWSKSDISPDYIFYQAGEQFRLVQSNAGDFLVRQMPVKEKSKLIGVIPLVRKFSINNPYLSNQWNDFIFDGERGNILPAHSATGQAITFKKQVVFQFQPFAPGRNSSDLLFALTSMAIAFFMLSVVIWIRALHSHKRYELAFIVVTASFVALRFFMLNFEYPGRWFGTPLWDAQVFASASYNASIGDLFVNAIGIVFLVTYLFYTFPRWRVAKYVLNQAGMLRSVTAAIALLLAYLGFLFPFLFVETIYHNSSLTLDITESIQSNWLRAITWLSVIAGSVSAFLWVHTFTNLASSLCRRWSRFIGVLVISGILFTAYFLIAERDYWITLWMGSLYFLLAYFLRLPSYLSKVQFMTFFYIFVVMTLLGVQHGWSVKRFAEERRKESHFKFASNYLIGRDILGEYLLNEATRRISQDAFIQSGFTVPFFNRASIRQKVRQIHLNSYFDRYDIQLYFYSANGEPLDNQSPAHLFSRLNEFESDAYRTDYKGIYFLKPTDSESGKRYISAIPILRAGLVSGYILIDLVLNRVIPQNVYPELLVDSRFVQYFESKDRSFAFVRDGIVLSSFGNYNYEQNFPFNMLRNSRIFSEGVEVDGLFHTAIEDDAGQVVVVSSQTYPLFYAITNFSFYFVSGVLLMVFVILLHGIFASTTGFTFTYATRIQLYIYVSFSLPLVIAVVTTLNRVSRSAEEQLNKDFQAKARHLSESLVSFVNSYQINELTRSDLENNLIERAKIANQDITVYNPAGKLVASSQPAIFENQLISGLIPYAILEHIKFRKENSLIQSESIGNLQFNNCYYSLRSPGTGELLGILSVPFFDSVDSLEATKISVLSNFISIFTLIFIIFSLLSFYVVNWLTFPLQYITRALGKTTLSGSNKPLEWKSNDEIGLMVNEYNRMLSNLEESKIELVRSQKESAWREIAKQIAHEIKNPLTPMKLTLQQMEQQLTSGGLDQERTKSALNTLLTQVEILNEIATSFSTFARMPAPTLTRLSLQELLKKCVDLFTGNPAGNVRLELSTQLYIKGDEQLLVRIFANIILNALQSGKPGEGVQVHISAEAEGEWVEVRFRDDGIGIKPEMTDRVFSPHFTTKQSGSGLGLAIAKQGIEQSGGEIWFESRPGRGTTFYVKLPRAV